VAADPAGQHPEPGQPQGGGHHGQRRGHDADHADGRGDAEGGVGLQAGEAQTHEAHQHRAAGEDDRASGRGRRVRRGVDDGASGPQSLDVPGDQQQRVVDADPEGDHRRDGRCRAADVHDRGQQQHARGADAEAQQRHRDRQTRGDDRPEGQHEQEQRHDDAGDLAGAPGREARAVGDLAAEGDLQPGGHGRLGGLLQR
jgi:hypothetical protein